MGRQLEVDVQLVVVLADDCDSTAPSRLGGDVLRSENTVRSTQPLRLGAPVLAVEIEQHVLGEQRRPRPRRPRR